MVRLAWVTVVAYIRIGTHPRVFVEPMSIQEATLHVAGWLARPTVGVLQPGPRHWGIFENLLQVSQASGNLVTDAHLAALAVEHGATLCSTDRDFTRFRGLKWVDPLTDG